MAPTMLVLRAAKETISEIIIPVFSRFSSPLRPPATFHKSLTINANHTQFGGSPKAANIYEAQYTSAKMQRRLP